MSQNGPYPGQPWSAGGAEPTGGAEADGPEQEYQAPADPWGEHTGGWGTDPYQTGLPPTGTQPAPIWLAPAPAPPTRRGPDVPIVVLIVVLGLLIFGGLGTTVYLLKNRTDDKSPATTPTTAAAAATTAAANPTPEPQDSQNARFVAKGQCVRNEGTSIAPKMSIVACGSGTYEVLARIEGRTTGESDAQAKCAKVREYTKWYFYDSELDDIDFVLCLKESRTKGK